MPGEHPLSLGLSRRLGELLVDRGVISRSQLQESVVAQRREGGKLGSLLISKGYITEEGLLTFLSEQCGISYVILSKYSEIPEEVIKCVPDNIARRHTLIPISKKDNTLTVAIPDPLNILILDDLKMMTGFEVKSVLASESEIQQAIGKYYGMQSSQAVLDDIIKQTGASSSGTVDVVKEDREKEGGESIITLGAKGEDAPIVQMVNLILSQAIRAKASDVHIEPYPKSLRVRYRIDGVLHEQPAPPKKFLNAIVSRLKIMSNLDIAERRMPQDGRIRLMLDGKEIDLRVSILPCASGEKSVLRILDSSGLKVRLQDLGLEPDTQSTFEKGIKTPYGIILITGPTGSGKSTTLYSALSTLNEPDVNIMTIEDPVEYQLSGVNQVSVNADVGLTFAAGLRSFLRQDPDVIMVGEIRDAETIGISINAALTGHLVFSTLHTNDASGAVTRIQMLGVEPFLISSSIIMVAAQRLMRRICKDCRETYEVDSQWLLKLGISRQALQDLPEKVVLARGKGCDNCVGTGYRGREGIYEVLEMNDAIRGLIMEREPATRIKDVARKSGMMTLREAAIKKVFHGVTTMEELLRVTASDVD